MISLDCTRVKTSEAFRKVPHAEDKVPDAEDKVPHAEDNWRSSYMLVTQTCKL